MSYELIFILCLIGGVLLALVVWAAGLHNRLLRVERDLKDETDYRRKIQSDFFEHTSDMRKALAAAGVVKTPRSEGDWVRR